jgi:PKD repeat protein
LANPTVATTYQVIAACTGGIFDTAYITINVVPIPTASFTYSPTTISCASTPISFTNTSSGGTLPYTYLWTFGAQQSTLANPNFSSNSNGCGALISNAILKVTDANNCISFASQNLNQNGIPIIPILVDSNTSNPFKNCVSSSGSINYNLTLNNVTANSNCVSSYTIDWGDGNIQTNIAAIVPAKYRHLYTAYGVFSIIITANGSNGCSISQTYKFQNLGLPSIGIGTNGNTLGCMPQVFCFKLKNYATNLIGTRYRWNFGDGSAEVVWNYNQPYICDSIFHTYTQTSCNGIASPGNFLLTVWAINDCDSVADIYTGVRIFSKPILSFSGPTQLTSCINTPVNYGANIIQGAGTNCPLILYEWDVKKYNSSFKDTLYSLFPTYTFATSGSYQIKLHAQNYCGSYNDSFNVCVDTTFTPLISTTADSGCVPFTPHFTLNPVDTSLCMAKYFTWHVTYQNGMSFINCKNNNGAYSFQNSTTLHSQNPIIKFVNPGIYIVYADVATGCGSSASTAITINAFSKPIPYLLTTGYSTCGSMTVHPKDSISALCNQVATPISNWTFSGGIPATSTALYPSVVFNTAGVHKITITKPNYCGSVYDTLFDTILPQPIVNAGNDITICKGQGDTLMASVITNGGSYTYAWSPTIWLSGSSSIHPFAFSAYDTTYILTATYGNSCYGFDSVKVHVNPSPILVIHNLKPAICMGDTAIIFATGGTNYTWTGNNILSNNNDTIFAIPTNTSVYSVSTTNNFNCTATQSTTVNVNPIPIVQVSPSAINSICFGNNITMQASGANTYSWSPATNLFNTNGISTIASPIVNTNYVLTGTSLFGCSDTVHFTINVNGNQSTSCYTLKDTICEGESTTLIATGSTSYLWSPPFTLNKSTGDSVIASPITTTTYLVTGAPLSGCPDTAILKIYVRPYINFLVQQSNPIICKNKNSDTILISGGTNFTWQPPTAGLQIISNNFVIASPTITSTYTLTGTNNIGCNISSSILVNVDTMPTPKFSHTANGCAGSGISFINNTSSNVNFLWKFGDGDTSSVLSPIHIYTSAGKYQITLIASNSGGCADSIFDSITIIATPQSAFTISPKNGCGPLNVLFTNLSTATNTTYGWSLGNGNNYNGITPPSTIYPLPYKNDSVFIVQLITTNQCGNAIATDSVIVKPLPKAGFGSNITTGCSPLSVLMANTSIGSPSNFVWHFGDGTSSISINPISHQYFAIANDSIYTLQLIASNSCGTDTFSKIILVHPNVLTAIINMNPLQGCAPFTTTFTAFTSGATSLYWNFGNSNFSTNTSSTQTYNTAGSYVAYLYANNGCSFDTEQVSVFVNPAMNINFNTSKSIACQGNSILFSNATSGLSNTHWNFGDGTSSTNSNQSHTYLQAGNYTTTFTGTSALYGCVDSISKTITVHPSPQINISATPFVVCVNQPIQFLNTSSNVNFHHWNFADGNSSNNFSPTHSFAVNGNYVVQYIGSNNFNCADTSILPITVNPTPVASFSINASAPCQLPSTISTFNSSLGANNYIWYDGNGNSSNNTNPSFTYLQGGIFPLQLIAQNNFGCADTFSQSITISQPLHAGFVAFPLTGCQPLKVLFTDTTSNAFFHNWNFGDGITSQNISVQHIYNSSGIFDVSLTIADAANICNDSIFKKSLIYVLPKPIANFYYEPLYTPIPEVGIIFHNHSIDALNYSWYFGDGSYLNTTDTFTKHNYTAYGKYDVMLIAIHSNGCTDTVIKNVTTEYVQNLTMPNAMMPMAGASDEVKIFKPKGIGLKKYRIEIFSTWGEKIWESSALDEHGSPKEYWDGTYQGNDATKKGMLLPQDVYIWKAEAVFADENIWKGNTYDGTTFSNTGTITLLR